ncbi:hypothetical protein NL676_034049 [Syzygium grande]|nr:hypothetical protein NL676_034049 [Syzygium grande]
MQGFVAAIYLVLFIASSNLLSHGIVVASPTYNVINYGATGSGVDDDTQAFVKAWGNTCGDSGAQGAPTLVVPGGKTFKLSPVSFKGPCKSSKIFVQIDGSLIAPSSPSGWKGCFAGSWLVFQDVANLNVHGSGQVDGQGSPWWAGAGALSFFHCINLVLSGLHHINSPRNHISISGCDGGTISNLRITAPSTSHNTDGLDISHTNHLNIHDLNIQTGDDCIAINGGSSYITITKVSCGPGHGISIGSLGKHGSREIVEEVQVRHCTFTGSMNGARIKTWQGGLGYAKNIVFDHITLNAVENPIIIDQFYSAVVAQENAASSVAVSNVNFTNFRGTSASDQAITLSCSSGGCSNLILDNIKIESSAPGKTVTASCKNAHGSATSTTPPVPCLLRGSGGYDGQGSLQWSEAKGFVAAVYLVLFAASSTLLCHGIVAAPSSYNVINYGAIGNGVNDDTQALAFFHCINLVQSGLQHVDSPWNHISISGCDGGTISNLRITAPGTSPNTDGLDISHTNHLNIHDLNIQTGDDCIAINGNSSYITITGVSCGPGHGISVGSLGAHGSRDTVEEVQVRNCTFIGSTNGARIETWQIGSGYAESIVFDQIMPNEVKNPIDIDQFYTNVLEQEDAASGVVVSNVTYSGFQGTSASAQAITLSCSSVGCSNIILDNIKLTSSTPGRTVTALCKNAHGSATLTTPPVPRLLR